MDWNAFPASNDRRLLSKAFVEWVPEHGVNRKTLALASEAVFGDAIRWREIFPSGATEALWFVSDVSDASMQASFLITPAGCMAEVIDTRLDQNRSMKRFVKRVMQYDLLHPFQALARMQRTARVMYACVSPHKRASFPGLVSLNLFYTALVFLWLIDGSPNDKRTKTATARAMRMLGI
ncbi:hypothetical protein [Dyella sp. GSA-30]|uniref:hypothetical protein n=1 Tax=Dyella sp. GSA-30 TaxID=2994496 RepID=UPI0024913AB6|nr:hypothetical protein [Dyella sp. GSA-30]BDU22450.1 hypothetical protein DYGSA30_39070 [Dyella sp. GSA-30]